MKKKVISMFLAIALITATFAGCSPEKTDSPSSDNPSETTASGDNTSAAKTADELLHEKYDEPVEINVVLGYRDSENPDTPDSVTPETATAVKKFKELFNIDLKYSWIVNSDQFEAKFGAELAAGNLPDVMYITPNQFEDLYSQGGLGDLTEAYAAYQNDSINGVVNFDGEIINAGTRDGKIYGLPGSTYPGQVTSQTYYRMDLLKQAGIEKYEDLPKTISEFETLCDKLLTLDVDGNGKTGDPIIPGNKWYVDAGLADFSPVFHAYESWPATNWHDDGTGNLISSAIQPQVKDSLTKLNEWYSKGYFAKDFAAQDVWGANAPIVSDIVAGKYPIVFGSWWIGNWPLNDNKKNQPDADWVVGPTLTVDGKQPTIMVPRYPVNNYTAISRDFKHPEAVFKMMNWSIEYSAVTGVPDFKTTATPEKLLDFNSNVYTWLPYRIYDPSSLITNYEFVAAADKAGKTTVTKEEAPNNTEFYGAWNSYVETKKGSKDPIVWGTYFSRVSPTGGVAQMYDLYTNAEKKYNEVYITTPTMITKKGEMDKFTDTTMLSMIMGETPISDFDKYVSQWKGLGGDEIQIEVNEWYKNK